MAAANSAYSSGGFKEVDATNMPGIYRLDIPNAAIASGARSVTVVLQGAANMVQASKEIEIKAFDLQTALQAVNTTQLNGSAAAASNLAASESSKETGTAQAGAAGTITLNTGANANNDFYKLSLVHIVSGTGQKQVRFIFGYNGTTKVASVSPNWVVNPDNTSVFEILPMGSVNVDMWGQFFQQANANGLPKVALTDIITTALGEGAAGRLAAAFQLMYNVATPALTTASVNQTGDSFTRIGATGSGLTSLAPSSTSVSNADYTTARAAKLDNADVATSTRLASAGYTAPDNADIALIKAKTDNLPAIPASQGDVTSAASGINTNLGVVNTNVLTVPASVWTVTARTLSTAGVNAIVSGILAAVVEGTITVQQSLMLLDAIAGGKADGAGTPVMHYRNPADTLNRVTANVDGLGNRTGMTLNFS